MHFALLGDHPDGIDLTRALTATGRYTLRVYSGPAPGRAQLQRLGLEPETISDLEEVLAHPEVDLVIVAGQPGARAAQLKRALQSECHVACVHPAGPSPDFAYEAALIQADTRRVLLPLLPMALHPGVTYLAGLAKDWQSSPTRQRETTSRAFQAARVLEMEIWSTEAVLLDSNEADPKPALPGWDLARLIGGELVEIFLQSPASAVEGNAPLLLTGRFQNGMLLQGTYLPDQAETRWRLSLVTATGRATLSFPQGWPGPAMLTYTDANGTPHTETWQMSDPWHAWIERFEQELDLSLKPRTATPTLADRSLAKTPALLGWEDALRALELDDAARRSVQYGRSSTLDLQEVTEEANFKGTMTLVGCSLIWLTLVLLIVAVWVPWLIWLIIPVFVIFLGLQTLRWVFPPKVPDTSVKK